MASEAEGLGVTPSTGGFNGQTVSVSLVSPLWESCCELYVRRASEHLLKSHFLRCAESAIANEHSYHLLYQWNGVLTASPTLRRSNIYAVAAMASEAEGLGATPSTGGFNC